MTAAPARPPVADVLRGERLGDQRRTPASAGRGQPRNPGTSPQYQFTANSGPHALHGLVTDLPWQVTGDGELSIELGDPWPWPCRVVQRTELSAGRATFRIEVHAHVNMPAAVGWHPWFVRRLAGTPAPLNSNSTCGRG